MIRWLPSFVVGGLLIVLMLQWIHWPPEPSETERAEPGEPGASAVAGADPDAATTLAAPDPKNSYASIIDRPLFRPERRPEDPSEADPQADVDADATATPLDVMDLSAVIITPTLVAAWVRDPGQQRLRQLRIGDDFEGWSVEGILPDRVLLERQGEQDALILRDYAKAPAPEPVSPPPGRRRPPRVIQPGDPPPGDPSEDDPQDH